MARQKGNGNGKLLPEAASAAASTALAELVKLVESLDKNVKTLADLQATGNFRYLSKRSRNALLSSLLEESANVKDSAVGTFRVLKKVKRERVPDKLIDEAITLRAGVQNGVTIPAPEKELVPAS